MNLLWSSRAKVYYCSRALQVPCLILRSSDISLIYLVLRGSRPKLSSLGAIAFVGERPGLSTSDLRCDAWHTERSASEKQDCRELGTLGGAAREI
jgi:hypothetical protein